MPRVDPSRQHRDKTLVRWNVKQFAKDIGTPLAKLGRELGFDPISFTQQANRGVTSFAVYKAAMMHSGRDAQFDHKHVRVFRGRMPLRHGDLVRDLALQFDRSHAGLRFRMEDGGLYTIAAPPADAPAPVVRMTPPLATAHALEEHRLAHMISHLRRGYTANKIQRHYVWTDATPETYFAEIRRRHPDLPIVYEGAPMPETSANGNGPHEEPESEAEPAVGGPDEALDHAMQLLARAINQRNATALELERARAGNGAEAARLAAENAELRAKIAAIEDEKKALEEIAMDADQQRDMAVRALTGTPVVIPFRAVPTSIPGMPRAEVRLAQSAKRVGGLALAQEIAAFPK